MPSIRRGAFRVKGAGTTIHRFAAAVVRTGTFVMPPVDDARLEHAPTGLVVDFVDAWDEADRQARRGITVVAGPGESDEAVHMLRAEGSDITVMAADDLPAYDEPLPSSGRALVVCERTTDPARYLHPDLLELHLLGLDPAAARALVAAELGEDSEAERVWATLVGPGTHTPESVQLRRHPTLLALAVRRVVEDGVAPLSLDDLADIDANGVVAALRAERDRFAISVADQGSVPEARFVPIPAGRAGIGSPPDEEGRWEDEGPVVEVEVGAFDLGRFAVTNSEYSAFLAEHASVEPPATWGDPRFDQPNQPVVGLSRADARRYAAGVEARLPSEAEWEYACRARSQAPRYGPLDDIAWHGGNSGWRLHPVGMRQPNAFGLYDTIGNAWEWVEDDFHPSHDFTPRDGHAYRSPTGTEPAHGILRGGTWTDSSRTVRAATRLKDHPGPRLGNVGVRLARSV